MTGFNTGKAYNRSGKFASQAVEHVRTVASLGRLNAFVDDYLRTLELPTKVCDDCSSRDMKTGVHIRMRAACRETRVRHERDKRERDERDKRETRETR